MSSPAAPATRKAPWSFAAPWGARGWVTDLDGPVHWVEFGTGEDTGAPPVVFVHGLGGSHLNWTLVGPALARGRRAVALDLHGFGLSPGSADGTTVAANTRLLDRFVAEVVGEPAVLMGNSMGGMISILQAHAHPATVAGLVLVDPALPAPLQRPDPRVAGRFLLYAVPGLGEMYLRTAGSRMSSRQVVEQVVGICFADPSRASPLVVDAGVALADARRSVPATERSFLAASRSLTRILARPGRYRAAMRDVRVPTLLISGEADRLVPVTAARAAAAQNPGWDTLFLPGVGHTPQLEVPELVVGAVQDWLARHPVLAAH